jgi:hypothetical protein
MRYKKTTMRRAFIEVGDDNFMSIEQVASDPLMRATAIASLKREIGRLSPAEKHVAKNTLHFLRTMRDGTANGRGYIRAFLAATGAVLGGVASAIRKIPSDIQSAARKAFGCIATKIHSALSCIESAVRKTLGSMAFAIRWALGGIDSAVRQTLGGIAFAIRWTLERIEFAVRKILGGIAFLIRETVSGVAFATRKARGAGAHLFARMRRVLAPGA